MQAKFTETRLASRIHARAWGKQSSRDAPEHARRTHPRLIKAPYSMSL
jgi:hypothetical protein